MLRPVYDATDALRRLRLARGRPRPRVRHRAHDGAGARVLGPRRPPQPDDQDPGHARGHPRDRGDDLRGAATSTSRSSSPSQAYEQVAEAYIRGLERRLAEGKSVDMRSVASFFVSRVDTEVDKRLEALGRTGASRAAPGLANARAAYRRFKAIFHGERFAELREAGASVQRPLWASTGVKDPAYPDTMYVDGLVGPETVNTMPMATLLAAADHATVERRDRRARPRARPARAGRGRHRPRRRHRASSCARASRSSSSRSRSCFDAHRRAGARRSSPRARRRSRPSIPDDLEPRIAARVREGDGRADVAHRIWKKDDDALGPGRRRPRSPTGSAG